MNFYPPDDTYKMTSSDTTDPLTNQHWITKGAAPTLAPLITLFVYRMRLRAHAIAICQLHRTPGEQEKLYAQGRTTPGKIVTDAHAWQSAHCCSINATPAAQAFDICINKNGIYDWTMDNTTKRFWSDARDTGTMLGLVWGATFNTPPRDFGHFQLSTFKAIQKCTAAH